MANRVKRREREALRRQREATHRQLLHQDKQRRKHLNPARHLRVVAAALDLEACSFGYLIDRFRYTEADPWVREWVDQCPAMLDERLRPLGYVHPNDVLCELLAPRHLRELAAVPAYRACLFGLLRCGAWIRPLRTWRPRRTRSMEQKMSQLLVHLLVRYRHRYPRCLTALFLAPNQDYTTIWSRAEQCYFFRDQDLNLGLFLAAGHGLHEAAWHPSAALLTSREHYFFSVAPAELGLHGGLVYAHLRALRVPDSLCLAFARAGLAVRDAVALEPVFRFLSRQPGVDTQAALRIGSFYYYQNQAHYRLPGRGGSVRPLYPGFSFKGRTVASVLRLAEEWEQYVEQRRHELLRRPYPASPVSDFASGNYRVRRLRTPEELFEEGRVMRHCVASYDRYCRQGETAIFTVEAKAYFTAAPARLATVQVTNEVILQVRGVCNNAPPEVAEGVVRAWAAREGLRFLNH